MEGEIRRHFDQIITSAKSLLNNIKIEEDVSVQRALLKISGKYKTFEVKVTEIIDEKNGNMLTI